ncbi:melibiose carrier protein [Oxobacter pfennigii]|uniref:Melibiose carrier protein n=1 Tax=Oxobacter pfennigii TaxID=36849 RepID=A0A0P8YVS0_9CLOT|nr:MFS transporter [Oxobacter pfennigii]KPU43804.1 melibiose carrier protein [Oxobacter pfennigii]
MAKLSNKDINAYSFYSFSSNFGNTMPLSYLNMFLTENLGYGPAVMGSILLVARILDFSVGLVSGSIFQKTNLKWGKYRSWLIILRWVVFSGITIQFLNTSALPMGARVVITFIGYGMLHFSMNFIQTAQFGVLSSMAGSDMEDRSRLSIRSSQWTAASMILTSAVTLPFITFLAKFIGDSNAFSATAILFALFMAIGNMVISKASEKYDLPAPKDAVSNTKSIKINDLVKSIVTNDQLLVYIIASSIYFIAIMTVSGIAAYYFIYVLGDRLLMSVQLTVTTAFGLVASLIGPKIGKMLGKKNAMVYGLFIQAACGVGVAIFAKNSLIVYIVFNCVMSVARYFFTGFGPNYVLDTGEYGYYRSGKDYRATATGLYTIPMKLGMAFGGAISAYGLALIGYKAGMTATPEFINNFMWILGGIPAALYALSGLIMLIGYKITDADAAKYAAANAEKAKAAAANA